MTLYALKPRFQGLLRPLVARLASAGVTANQVTVAAALGSVGVAAIVIVYADQRSVFLLLPLWLFLRMGLNAIDGMLAREFAQKSRLGAYLNEICDVVSDAALYAPFAVIAPFGVLGVGTVIFLSALSELAGVLGQTVGASRRYDGPMGKSDRALVFGALGFWVGIGAPLPAWLGWLMALISLLLVITIINRVRSGLAEAKGQQPC
ncbi:MAG: CDP-alcohol phosphatidyltransferase family protein [Xanthobacteraceae bacterium]